MRGLRQIMKKKHTWYERAHTNQHVIESANAVMDPKGIKKIARFSEFYEKRKISY